MIQLPDPPRAKQTAKSTAGFFKTFIWHGGYLLVILAWIMICRRVLLVALPIALLSAGGSFLAERPPRASCKPVAPIDIEASIVGDPATGFGVSARATSRVAADVDLEVILPDGVTHLAGERRKRGRRCDVKIDLHAADRTRKEIAVVATITDGQARLTKVVPLVIFDGPPEAPKGRPARDPRGTPILEFSP